MNAADRLEDLKIPPGNSLEPLMGNRRGQHSIRINDRWRVCFVYDLEVEKDRLGRRLEEIRALERI